VAQEPLYHYNVLNTGRPAELDEPAKRRDLGLESPVGSGLRLSSLI
jgi:hypothetical protein